jgi:hypothetical protein
MKTVAQINITWSVAFLFGCWMKKQKGEQVALFQQGFCLFVCWDRISPCNLGWPQTLNLPASPSLSLVEISGMCYPHSTSTSLWIDGPYLTIKHGCKLIDMSHLLRITKVHMLQNAGLLF